jgi:hypothetical protein
MNNAVAIRGDVLEESLREVESVWRANLALHLIDTCDGGLGLKRWCV